MANTSTNRLVLEVDSNTKGAVAGLRELEGASAKTNDAITQKGKQSAAALVTAMQSMTDAEKRILTAQTAWEYQHRQAGSAQLKTVLTARLGDYKEYSREWLAVSRQIDRVEADLARQAETRRKEAARQAASVRSTAASVASNVSPVTVGGVAGVAVTAAAAAVAKSINLAADTEKSLNQLQFQSKATGDQMAVASAKARELGADIKLPATSSVDAAKAMLETSKAGFTLQESMDSARGSLALAAAAEIDAGEAANITAGLLKAFNLEGKESGRVADLLAASANNSVGEITDMAKAAQQGAEVFHAAKFTVSDLTTDISLMANAGIKGSDAGTSLKTAVLALTAPTDTARAEMKRLGLQLYDTNGTMVSHDEVVRRVSKSLVGLSDQQRNHALKAIFGTDAIRAANIVFAAGVDKVEAMRAKVEQAGAASDTAAAKNQGLKGSLDGLSSSLDSFAEKYGSKFLDPLTSGVNKLGELVGMMDRAIERQNTLADGSKKKIDPYSPYALVKSGWDALKATDEAATRENDPAVRAAQARIDAQSFRAAKNKPVAWENDDLLEAAKKYNTPLNRSDWSSFFDPKELDAVANAAEKQAKDFVENARITRLQDAVSKSAKGEQTRLMGRANREQFGQDSGKPTRHVPTAEEVKAAEARREDAANAARVIAEGRAQATKETLAHAFDKYEKQGAPGGKTIVLQLAGALRIQQRGEADADFARNNKQHPQTVAAERARAYQNADAEYNDMVKRRLPESETRRLQQGQAEEAKAAAAKARHAFDKWIKFYEENAAALSPEKRAERLTDLAKRRATLLATEASATLRGDLASGQDTAAKKTARSVALSTLADESAERIHKATEKAEGERLASIDKATAQGEKNAEIQAETERKRLDASITSLQLQIEETHDLETLKGLRVQLLSAQIDRIMAEKASADAQVNHDEAAAKAKAKGGKLTPGHVAEFDLRREQNGIVANNAMNAASAANTQAGKTDVRNDAAQQAANFRERADAAKTLTDRLNLLSEAQAQERIAAGPQSASERDALEARQYAETNPIVIDILKQQADAALFQAAITGDVTALQSAVRLFNMARMRALGPDGVATQQRGELASYTDAANLPNSKLRGGALAPIVQAQIAGIGRDAVATGNPQLEADAHKAGEAFALHVHEAARAFGRDIGGEMQNAGGRLVTGVLRGQMGHKSSRESVLKQVGGDLWGTTTDTAGKALSHELGRGVTNEWKRAVRGDLAKDFAGIGKTLKDNLMSGGNSAGKSIGQAALLLMAAYNLSGKAGKKKQKNSFIGAALGFAAGSVLPGIGNLEGAEIGATLGGMFATGGRYPVGRDILVGERGPEIVRLDLPGIVVPNHKMGDALRASNRFGLATNRPGLVPPTLPENTFTGGSGAGALQTAVEAVRGMATSAPVGAAGYGDVNQHITVFGGVHGDKAVGRAGKTWGSSLNDALQMR